MDNGILKSIKKLLGVDEADTSFDLDIMTHINSVFMVLRQIGVGPAVGYSISTGTETWNEFLSGNVNIAAVRTYVYLRVQLLFDPPTNPSILEAKNRIADQLEWRLNAQEDTTPTT